MKLHAFRASRNAPASHTFRVRSSRGSSEHSMTWYRDTSTSSPLPIASYTRDERMPETERLILSNDSTFLLLNNMPGPVLHILSELQGCLRATRSSPDIAFLVPAVMESSSLILSEIAMPWGQTFSHFLQPMHEAGLFSLGSDIMYMAEMNPPPVKLVSL